jgi:hypothetical protein
MRKIIGRTVRKIIGLGVGKPSKYRAHPEPVEGCGRADAEVSTSQEETMPQAPISKNACFVILLSVFKVRRQMTFKNNCIYTYYL